MRPLATPGDVYTILGGRPDALIWNLRGTLWNEEVWAVGTGVFVSQLSEDAEFYVDSFCNCGDGRPVSLRLRASECDIDFTSGYGRVHLI